mmetsp:Transcript_18927/g.27852  ORF Transcript_18927/g.27852 Transcript_18927/m.27852 type:complete len:109 (+) Transcript_18927:245-571(+)
MECYDAYRASRVIDRQTRRGMYIISACTVSGTVSRVIDRQTQRACMSSVHERMSCIFSLLAFVHAQATPCGFADVCVRLREGRQGGNEIRSVMCRIIELRYSFHVDPR